MDDKFSWVKTHQQLVEYLKSKENDQVELIILLKSIGIDKFQDQSIEGVHDSELEEIDPFTFFCYIYKHGSVKRLELIQELAKKLNISIPNGESGIPSAQAQKVWLFPYKYQRTNNEVKRLWSFFKKSLSNTLSDEDFQDVLQIRSTAKTKITEGLFYTNPTKYLPINTPTKNYLEDVLKIEPGFNTYNEYISLLNNIKSKTNKPFYELSYEAWKWNDQNQTNKKSLKKSENTETKYWLFSPGENATMWEEFYSKGIMGLGWDEIGDLQQYKNKSEIKDALFINYGGNGSKTNDINANYDFLNTLNIGDIIIAKKGRKELIGYGLVASEYQYDINRENYQKIRKVDWKLNGNWKVDFDLVLKTLTDITKYKSDHPEYNTFYEKLLAIMTVNNNLEDLEKVKHPLNVIFYGPPGTGKTYNSIIRAAEIVENRKIDSFDTALGIFNSNLHKQIEFITFHQNYNYEDFIQGIRPDTENDRELTFERKDGIFKIMADKALKNILESEKPPVIKKSFESTFNKFVNPLIEGDLEELEVKMKKVSYFITAVTDKSIEFRKDSGNSAHTLSISTLRKMYEAESVLNIQGLSSYYSPLLEVLLKIGKDSAGRKDIVKKKNYVIIIDEINRANISRVFGELITLIEPDKRSHGKIPLTSKLPSGDTFTVPSNLYIIGTMNTADKSIALLDIALRRRFEFESMYPKYFIGDKEIYDVDILIKINEYIINTKGYDFQIGHAYFMGENDNLVERMNKKVIPLLLEYYMNDKREIEKILNSAGLKIQDYTWPLQISGRND